MTILFSQAVVVYQSFISSIFTREVQYWEPQIVAWSRQYDLDPDIIATIMQIESCGDPQARSAAGAQGLFQVMPYHFASGEDMFAPDTNAHRGLTYYTAGLRYHQDDIFLSFAGYNAGHGVAALDWAVWPTETQRYYYWSTGIYTEAKSGLNVSPT
ncbi:MAG: transglycosylase SLT domain-containing protein [Chloroflexi bacterium]|nr:transglycosylase SLT domain-containing protein [Chloroflexota bacterium]